MNSSVLITLLIITVSALLIGMIAWVYLRPSLKAEALPTSSSRSIGHKDKRWMDPWARRCGWKIGNPAGLLRLGI